MYLIFTILIITLASTRDVNSYLPILRTVIIAETVPPVPCPGHEKSAAICTLPAVTGDCRAAMPRYFYDVTTSGCKEFTFGGCGGNGNNFETLHDCEKLCSSAKSGGSNSSDCSSEPDGGNCMAYFERYAYHPVTGSCEKFVYGGCAGNGNRYSSQQECEEHCSHSGAARPEQKPLVEGIDYDTKVCGMSECPMDCGHVRREGDCMFCHCGDSPFSEPDELVVPAGLPCPPGHSLLRKDGDSSVCIADKQEPLPAA